MRTSNRARWTALIAAALAVVLLTPAGASGGATAGVGVVQVGGGTRPVIVRGNSWFVRDTLTGGVADHTFTYGQAGDLQLMGDWDGDGEVTPGVVRGSTWMLRNSLSAGPPDATFSYGFPGDYPVVGTGTATAPTPRGWSGAAPGT